MKHVLRKGAQRSALALMLALTMMLSFTLPASAAFAAELSRETSATVAAPGGGEDQVVVPDVPADAGVADDSVAGGPAIYVPGEGPVDTRASDDSGDESALAEITPAAITDGQVAAIGDQGFDTFADALAAAAAGDTIVLLADVTHTSIVVHSALSIDLGGHTLTLTGGPAPGNTATVSLYAGGAAANLRISNGTVNAQGTVLARTGAFISAWNNVQVNVNSTGVTDGVFAMESSTVTLGGAISGTGRGVTADSGSTVSIIGSLSGGSAGVGAWAGSTVNVSGNVSSSFGWAAATATDATIKIGGNLSTTNFMRAVDAIGSSVVVVGGDINANGAAIVAADSSDVTAYGSVTGNPAFAFVVDGVVTPADLSTATVSADTIVFSEGEAFITVANHGLAIAFIDDGTNVTYFADLGDALAAATTGQTITLLTDVTHTSLVMNANPRNIIFDLDGHTLTLTGGPMPGFDETISVYAGNQFNPDVSFTFINGLVDATGGIFARSGATITLAGNVVTDGTRALFAREAGSTINFTGNATTTSDAPRAAGVLVQLGGAVNITGNVSAPNGNGIEARGGGVVTMNGDLTAGRVGIAVGENSQVVLNGAITAPYYVGTYATADDLIVTSTKTATERDAVSEREGYTQFSFADGAARIWIYGVDDSIVDPGGTDTGDNNQGGGQDGGNGGEDPYVPQETPDTGDDAGAGDGDDAASDSVPAPGTGPATGEMINHFGQIAAAALIVMALAGLALVHGREDAEKLRA